jgi:hypothetical protein
MNTKKNYADQMFTELSKIIEHVGKDDEEYTNQKKAVDVLNVLESLLAYTIYTTCYTTEDVRDAAEDSYISIKRQALAIIRKNPPKE